MKPHLKQFLLEHRSFASCVTSTFRYRATLQDVCWYYCSLSPVFQVIRVTVTLRLGIFFMSLQFPPYATNETGRPGALGRRELGHGRGCSKCLLAWVFNPFFIRCFA